MIAVGFAPAARIEPTHGWLRTAKPAVFAFYRAAAIVDGRRARIIVGGLFEEATRPTIHPSNLGVIEGERGWPWGGEGCHPRRRRPRRPRLRG
ncbi:MAG: hypothetical protein O3A10_01265 [Chloroflexi bacterium]|nr:hypothetical protein [Chloroflexota bacterium]MDA1147258.1 hypothetical protein [Chloroflexota bacterium]